MIQRQNEETIELKKETKSLYDGKIKTFCDKISKDVQENDFFFGIS